MPPSSSQWLLERQGGAFSSYELWDRDPTPNSYTDYCRACWPMEGPVFGAAEVAAESSDDNSEEEDTDDAEDDAEDP